VVNPLAPSIDRIPVITPALSQARCTAGRPTARPAPVHLPGGHVGAPVIAKADLGPFGSAFPLSFTRPPAVITRLGGGDAAAQGLLGIRQR